MRRSGRIALLITSLLIPLLASVASAEDDQDYRNPLGKAARSVVVPGWGQWSNQQTNKGTVFFVVAVVGVLLGTAASGLSSTDNGEALERAVGWSMYGLSAVTSTYDAYRTAEDFNRENGYDLAQKSEPTIRLPVLRVRF